VTAAEYCFTAGCWTCELTSQLGFRVPIKPIRGQMVLLRAARPLFSSVINAGLRYLVPRDDGRILVGSTMEDVGFDSSTTARGVADLLAFALTSAPRLADCAVERSWAGLRPATTDGLPVLGRIPHLQNAWIAAGHFRNGLTLSTGTAEIMGRLLCGCEPKMDLAPYSPVRFSPHQADASAPPRSPRATHDA
jgi:glycine oxidase